MAVGSVGDTGHGLVLSLAADREILEGLLDDLSESDGLILRKIDQQVVDGGVIQDLNICHVGVRPDLAKLRVVGEERRLADWHRFKAQSLNIPARLPTTESRSRDHLRYVRHRVEDQTPANWRFLHLIRADQRVTCPITAFAPTYTVLTLFGCDKIGRPSGEVGRTADST